MVRVNTSPLFDTKDHGGGPPMLNCMLFKPGVGVGGGDAPLCILHKAFVQRPSSEPDIN